MCDYVMMALPVGFDTDKLAHAEKVGARKFSKALIDPYRSRGQIFEWHYTHKCFCDCGTVIGHVRWIKEGFENRGEVKKEKLIKKWKRKNWSEAKIFRALASRQADFEHKSILMTKRVTEEEISYLSCAEKWLEFLMECKIVLKEESFFVTRRWFTQLKKRVDYEEKVVIEALAPRDLLWWKENVAYCCH